MNVSGSPKGTKPARTGPLFGTSVVDELVPECPLGDLILYERLDTDRVYQ